MLPAKHRLNRQTDFRRVYAFRQSFYGPGLRLNLGRNGLEYSRFGIVVPKKTAKLATERNRLKRLLRESIRPVIGLVSPGFDIVINCQSGCPDTLPAASDSILKLFRKSKLLK